MGMTKTAEIVRHFEPWDSTRSVVSTRTVVERHADGSVTVSYAGVLQVIPADCVIEVI